MRLSYSIGLAATCASMCAGGVALAEEAPLRPCPPQSNTSSSSAELNVFQRKRRQPTVRATVESLTCADDNARITSTDVTYRNLKVRRGAGSAGPFRESIEISPNRRQVTTTVSRRYKLKRRGPDCFAKPEVVEETEFRPQGSATSEISGSLDFFKTRGGKRC